MMMINKIKYALLLMQLQFRRFAFLFCLVLLLLLPRLGSAALYTFGESYSTDRYLEYCGHEHFEEKYNSDDASCWSCTVTNALMNAFLYTVNKMVDTVSELANLILLFGAAIWLAMYFLKSVSSMAAQDSVKILDGAFTFMFKVALVYILINGGIANIISWIITPLLSIGMDVSHALGLMSHA